MKLLTGGKIVLISADDYDKVISRSWSISRGYAKARIGHNIVMMHRYILGLEKYDGILVDHINHNKLDNRRKNLRLVTDSQNCWNRSPNAITPSKHSRFKGVTWHKTNAKWSARVQFKKRRIECGYFRTELEAAAAYNKKAKKVFGKYAYLNKL